MGYSQEYKEEYTGHYLLAEDGTETVPDGITASLVKLDNFTDNHPWYEYDEETKEYKRFQFGKNMWISWIMNRLPATISSFSIHPARPTMETAI